MPKGYRHPNGRIISRSTNGQFRKSNLKDLGISDDQLQKERAVCAECGYGEREEWFPILKSGICPKCGSTDKEEQTANKSAKQEPPYIKNGFIDPFLFNKWRRGELE